MPLICSPFSGSAFSHDVGSKNTFVFVSPAEDEESLCGTLGVAVHSARLQQPACGSHDCNAD